MFGVPGVGRKLRPAACNSPMACPNARYNVGVGGNSETRGPSIHPIAVTRKPSGSASIQFPARLGNRGAYARARRVQMAQEIQRRAQGVGVAEAGMSKAQGDVPGRSGAPVHMIEAQIHGPHVARAPACGSGSYQIGREGAQGGLPVHIRGSDQMVGGHQFA